MRLLSLFSLIFMPPALVLAQSASPADDSAYVFPAQQVLELPSALDSRLSSPLPADHPVALRARPALVEISGPSKKGKLQGVIVKNPETSEPVLLTVRHLAKYLCQDPSDHRLSVNTSVGTFSLPCRDARLIKDPYFTDNTHVAQQLRFRDAAFWPITDAAMKEKLKDVALSVASTLATAENSALLSNPFTLPGPLFSNRETSAFVICDSSPRPHGESLRVTFDGHFYQSSSESLYGCSGSPLVQEQAGRIALIGLYHGFQLSTRDQLFEPITIEDFQRVDAQQEIFWSPSAGSEDNGGFDSHDNGGFDSHDNGGFDSHDNGDPPGQHLQLSPDRTLQGLPPEVSLALADLPNVRSSDFVVFLPGAPSGLPYFDDVEGKVVCDRYLAHKNGFYDLDFSQNPEIQHLQNLPWLTKAQLVSGRTIDLYQTFHQHNESAEDMATVARVIQYDTSSQKILISHQHSEQQLFKFSVGGGASCTQVEKPNLIGLEVSPEIHATRSLGDESFRILHDFGRPITLEDSHLRWQSEDTGFFWLLDQFFGDEINDHPIQFSGHQIFFEDREIGRRQSYFENDQLQAPVNPCLQPMLFTRDDGSVVLYNSSMRFNLGWKNPLHRQLLFLTQRVTAESLAALHRGEIKTFTYSLHYKVNAKAGGFTTRTEVEQKCQ